MMNRPALFPVRRYLAVDVGDRCIKVMLVSVLFGRLRVHAHRLIGLDEDTRPGAPGWQRVLEEIHEDLGMHPMLVSVPQHSTVSQVSDLPASDARSVRGLIERDVVSLTGLTESAIVFDYGQLVPFGQYTNPYWVTHARESEVLGVLEAFENHTGQVWEVTSTGNALAAAYRECQPGPTNVMLVDLGSGGTEVAIVYGGQCVYMTSFAVGGLFFQDIIRQQRGCSIMEAEFIKNTEDLLSGDHSMPELRQLVDRWHGEMVRILEDWLAEHPALGVSASSFGVVLSGGDAQLPGLIAYLRGNSVLSFQTWDQLPQALPVQPEGQFAVAYGLATLLLRRRGPSASLVPESMRAVRKEQSALQMLHAGTWVVLLIIALVLSFGVWQKSNVVRAMEDQFERAEDVIEKARQTDALKLELSTAYEAIRPVLERQQDSVAAVRSLSLLSQEPLPGNAWLVLFADAASYYSAPELPPVGVVTNLPSRTGFPLAVAPPLPTVRHSNAFIAEISTSLDPLDAGLALSLLIDNLKTNGLFGDVDILSPDEFRNLVPPTVLAMEGHYAIAIGQRTNEYAVPYLSSAEVARLRAELNSNRLSTAATTSSDREVAGP